MDLAQFVSKPKDKKKVLKYSQKFSNINYNLEDNDFVEFQGAFCKSLCDCVRVL